MAIVLASTAGTLFGTTGVILCVEAMAATLIVAGILFLSQDRWLTFGLAAALTASLVVIAGSIRLHESRGEGGGRTAVATVPNPPVHWQGQVISQAMADKANFRGADLDGANLNGIQLSHKDFDGAQANGASFLGSQLEYASLSGVSLRGACLEGANLTGANLTGADFSGADVAGVIVASQAKRAALAWPAADFRPASACTLDMLRTGRGMSAAGCGTGRAEPGRGPQRHPRPAAS